MRTRPALCLTAILVLSVVAVGQQVTAPTVQRDSQAMSILTQAITASGGTQAVGAIQDFTGKGTMTYFWGGQQVSGNVTVQGRGTGQFRVDAVLPKGTRSVAINDGPGALQDANGAKSDVPFHNGVNMGALSLPVLNIQAALVTVTTSITTVGQATVAGRPAYQIRVVRTLGMQDPGGVFKTLASVDYFIDATTYQVVETQHQTHPKETWTKNYLDEIDYSDFQTVTGVTVPMSITEKIAGQEVSTIQLTSVEFNSGLTDSSFQL